MADYRSAGVEGLLVKAVGGAYLPGRRDWLKVKSRETTEVIVGGVIESLERPSQLIAGRYRDGELQVVGRSTPLNRVQSAEVAAALTRAIGEHPWPQRIGTGAFGGGRPVGADGACRTDRGGRGISRRSPDRWCVPAPAAVRADASRPRASGRADHLRGRGPTPGPLQPSPLVSVGRADAAQLPCSASERTERRSGDRLAEPAGLSRPQPAPSAGVEPSWAVLDPPAHDRNGRGPNASSKAEVSSLSVTPT